MPILEEKSLANKSSNLKIEHFIWTLPTNEAVAGPDLFSTFWAAISSLFNAAGTATRVDLADVSSQNVQTTRWVRLYFPFCHFTLNDPKSPFLRSLAKTGGDEVRWRRALEWPLGWSAEDCHRLAADARSISKSLAALAQAEARTDFENRVVNSIELGGDRMLHQFLKNEQTSPSTIFKDGRVIIDPSEVLAAHSLTWSQQWKAGQDDWVLEALSSISDAIARSPRPALGSARSSRPL